ncbi:putative GTP-binding protein [Trypanosoma grayi]|uniref:putative GTP-binding protein n=1 Tax=Trypanosoma grayi TaxID=71804 RepID=UPI0004F4AE7B|nr:putative GTP-binding protein [Trypanosoma grayi]KEG07984.1 putative GTP-binding protein [Trypanosoma grayi]
MHSLGKSFQRSKQAAQRNNRAKYRGLLEAERDASTLREAEQQQQRRKGAPLKSIWETSNLEEFLLIADAREKGYEAARDLRVVVDGTPHVVTNNKVVPLSDDRVDWLKLSELLTIPRRPAWRYDMSAEEVQALETSAFFEWRRRLAVLEEEHKVVMTPYEKNLEVWRQLWRVAERADVVLMILDARNPLVFRCADFEAYVRGTLNKAGGPKEVILLLNKSDLLTESQRRAWAAYFTGRGESFIFFSATPAKKKEAAAEEEDDDNNNDDDDDDNCSSNNNDDNDPMDEKCMSKLMRDRKEKRRHQKKSLRAPVEVANPYELVEQRRAERARQNQQKQQPQRKAPKPLTADERARDERVSQQQQQQRHQRLQQQSQQEPWAVLDPEQLLDRLAVWRVACGITDMETPLMVGLVGYPNVGKSSTINAILGCKKVVVSATPGKTKHFQTLPIPNERRVALCDCPGLVFPSFSSTREEMVCEGILPIDTATEASLAVDVLCRRIPRQVLEQHFNVSLLVENDADDSASLAERFLNAVARRRGYLGAHDRPNKSRAARDVLKLYVDGALVYVEPPPNYTPAPDAAIAAVTNTASVSHNKGAKNQSCEMGRYAAFTSTSAAAAATAGETGNEEWEDVLSDEEEEGDGFFDDEDEDAWNDLDSAAEARALSEASDDDADDLSVIEAAPPMFYVRPKGMRGVLSRREAFNAEGNAVRIAAAVAAAAASNAARQKRRTNHQLEPVVDTFVNDEGDVELIIDDDDGILELVGGVSRAKVEMKQQKQKSKRQTRRELKRSGAGPINPTARKMGVQGY